MESKRFASFNEFSIDWMSINLKKFGHVSTVEVDDSHFMCCRDLIFFFIIINIIFSYRGIISSLIIKKSINISSLTSTTNNIIRSKMSNLIDGNAIAAQIRVELAQRVTEMKETLGNNDDDDDNNIMIYVFIH